MSDKYGKLAQNTMIFAIGSFSSKALAFFIVPLYTYVLTTEEYGQIDLIATAVGLMVPFTTLLIQESIIRFVMGNEVSNETAITNAVIIFIGGAIISFLLWPCYSFIFGFGEYTGIFVAMLILSSFTQIFSQYLRAIEENIKFTLNGIISTAITLGCNIIFLLYFDWGMKGYLYSTIVAQIISALYIIFAGKILKLITFSSADVKKIVTMLKYSVPLIPNSLMWWVMSAGDKYIINYYLGDGENGLYSLALKIPTIISMIYTIFYQAWQMSAIQESRSNDTARFYENVYVMTNAFLIFLVSGIILVVKPLFTILMGEDFICSWQYVPLLAVAAYFNCNASFFGVVYTVSKESHKALYTTIAGACLNILVSFILITFIGMYGVLIGTIFGYGLVLLIRMKDTKKQIGMKFDIKRSGFVIMIIIIQAIITTYDLGSINYCVGIVAIVLIVFLYRREILKIGYLIKSKLVKNKQEGCRGKNLRRK